MQEITQKEMQEMGSGALESPEDYRYINSEHIAGATPDLGTFAQSFHLDFNKVPDVYQRKIGACTCHTAAEMKMRRNLRLSGSTRVVSPRFTYSLAKIEDGIADQTEQGTYPVMALKVGVKYGFASEDTCTNDTTLPFADYIYGKAIGNIPQAAFDEAANNKIPGYVQVGKFSNVTAANIMQALTQYQDGVKTCLPIGTEWWTDASGNATYDSLKILPIRKCVSVVSGHDIVITGWEIEAATKRVVFFFRNHWSTAWANQDNGWLYFDDHTITEAWAITEIPDALLSLVKSLPARNDFKPTFEKDLLVGETDADVQNLQIALKIVGTFPFAQNVTTYFGPLTKAAVMAFQKEYKVTSDEEIAEAAGKVGPKTRQALNKIFA